MISEKDDMDSSSSVDFYSYLLFIWSKKKHDNEIDEELKIYAKGTYEEMANITCR